MSNKFGNYLAFTCFGESHGRCVGALLDGCPAGLELSERDLEEALSRRVPKLPGISSTRVEEDKVEILSGLFRGYTTGAPLLLLTWNRDIDDAPYEEIRHRPRPGHADYPAWKRYGGFNDYRGGGMFSGRLTVPYLMAGAVALKLLRTVGVEVLAHTVRIHDVKVERSLSFEEIKAERYLSPVRCADRRASKEMVERILKAKESGDSVGGVIQGIALNMPPGVGDPLSRSIDADIAALLFAIPGVKGVEVGAGFRSAEMTGSQNNDAYIIEGGKIVTATNNAGGILGGLTSGMPIVVNVAFKPTPSIAKRQRTVDLESMEGVELAVAGRHDPCIVPKAVPVVEAMLGLALADHLVGAGRIPRVVGVKG